MPAPPAKLAVFSHGRVGIPWDLEGLSLWQEMAHGWPHMTMHKLVVLFFWSEICSLTHPDAWVWGGPGLCKWGQGFLPVTDIIGSRGITRKTSIHQVSPGISHRFTHVFWDPHNRAGGTTIVESVGIISSVTISGLNLFLEDFFPFQWWITFLFMLHLEYTTGLISLSSKSTWLPWHQIGHQVCLAMWQEVKQRTLVLWWTFSVGNS